MGRFERTCLIVLEPVKMARQDEAGKGHVSLYTQLCRLLTKTD
jgi:hypothetical protein